MIPILLAGAVLVAGAVGIKKGVDAYDDNKEAKTIYEKAKQAFNNAQTEMEETKKLAVLALSELGTLKLEVWKNQFSRFVGLA